MGYAARFSTNIEADFELGYSYSGWMVKPQASLEALVEELADNAAIEWFLWEKVEEGRLEAEEALDRAGINYAWSEELGGYLPVERGLCAFYSDESEEEAIGFAQADSRFATGEIKLYIFQADSLGIDQNDGNVYSQVCQIVKPTSAAKLVK